MRYIFIVDEINITNDVPFVARYTQCRKEEGCYLARCECCVRAALIIFGISTPVYARVPRATTTATSLMSKTPHSTFFDNWLTPKRAPYYRQALHFYRAVVPVYRLISGIGALNQTNRIARLDKMDTCNTHVLINKTCDFGTSLPRRTHL